MMPNIDRKYLYQILHSVECCEAIFFVNEVLDNTFQLMFFYYNIRMIVGHGVSWRRSEANRRVQEFSRLSVSTSPMQRRPAEIDTSRLHVLG